MSQGKTIAQEDMGVDDIWQVHIADQDQEFEELACLEVDPPEEESAKSHADSRALLLTHGNEPEPVGGWEDPEMIGITESDDRSLQRVTMVDRPAALGYYLHGIEMHDIGGPEVAVLGSMQEDLELDIMPYLEWQQELSERDRKLRLLDLLDYRVDRGDFVAGLYPDVSTWRETGLNESQEKLAKEIRRTIKVAPRECYKTAARAATKHQDNHRVEYAEGVVLPKQAAQAIRHAWIEIDGKVAEITWPWHAVDGAEAVYFGETIDTEEVSDKLDRWGGYHPFIMDDEEVEKLGQVQSQLS